MSHISKRMRWTHSIGKSYYDKIPNGFIELLQNIVASAIYIDRGASMFDCNIMIYHLIQSILSHFDNQFNLCFDVPTVNLFRLYSNITL